MELNLDFLKPDIKRIILLGIIGTIYYFFWAAISLVTTCEDCMSPDLNGVKSVLYGYPLPVSLNFTLWFSSQFALAISAFFLIFDIAIWYLLSCELVMLYETFGSKIPLKLH